MTGRKPVAEEGGPVAPGGWWTGFQRELASPELSQLRAVLAGVPEGGLAAMTAEDETQLLRDLRESLEGRGETDLLLPVARVLIGRRNPSIGDQFGIYCGLLGLLRSERPAAG